MNRFRRKRFEIVLDLLKKVSVGKSKVRVLDIGGTTDYWDEVKPLWSDLPLEITLVNVNAPSSDEPPYFLRGGDACQLAFPDHHFDLVHSNSVIEHVGHWKDISAMASEVRRLAPRFYVQTPAFEFPLEPHYRTLFFHWYSESRRAAMLVAKGRGFTPQKPDLGAAMEHVQSVNLLTARDMRFLFPDAQLRSERVLGLTKSHIAVR